VRWRRRGTVEVAAWGGGEQGTMIQLDRRASLVAVLLLVVSAGAASAECAFVLWTYISSSSSDKTAEERWRPLGSYAALADCQEDQPSALKVVGTPAATAIEQRWLRDLQSRRSSCGEQLRPWHWRSA
jgi:hypothetical protein